MKKHCVILGLVQFMFGMLISILLIATNFSNLESIVTIKWWLQMFVGICFFVSAFSGFYLVKNKPWAVSLSKKTSFIWLVFFPLGLLVIAYNFWLIRQINRGVN